MFGKTIQSYIKDINKVEISQYKKRDKAYTRDESDTNVKNDTFKEKLDSNVKKSENKDIEDTKDVSSNNNIDKLKEKIKEIEESSKENGDVDVNYLLNELINMFKNLDESCSELNINQEKNIVIDNENKTLLNTLDTLIESTLKESKLDKDLLVKIKGLLESVNAEVNLKDNSNNKIIEKIISKVDQKLSDLESGADIKLNFRELNNNSNFEKNDKESNEHQSEKFPDKDIAKENKFLKSLASDNDNSIQNNHIFGKGIQNVEGNTVQNKVVDINKATFTQDLIKDVKYMSINNLKELIVKVNPGDLGEITIKLIQEDGLMKAHLKANTKDTTLLLNQNLIDIKKELSEQAIKISDVNVELYQDDTTFFNDGSFKENLSQNHSNRNGNEKNKKVDVELGMSAIEEVVEDTASDDNSLDFLA